MVYRSGGIAALSETAMNYTLKAYLTAATLPVWLMSSLWFEGMRIATAPIKATADLAGRDEQ